MGPTWVLSGPGVPHVGPINVAFRDVSSAGQGRGKHLVTVTVHRWVPSDTLDWQPCHVASRHGSLDSSRARPLTAIITELVLYHLVKSLQLIWTSGTKRFHLTLQIYEDQIRCNDLTHYKAVEKQTIFCRRHFQMHFPERRRMHFDQNFIRVFLLGVQLTIFQHWFR